MAEGNKNSSSKTIKAIVTVKQLTFIEIHSVGGIK